MSETIFIRSSDDSYDEACDVAGTPLRNKGSGSTDPSAYVGMVRGSHTPTDALHYEVIDPSTAWSWVDSKGYEQIPNDPPGS